MTNVFRLTGWRAPLAVQVMGLVIVTLAGAIAAHAAIALLTPPPTPEIYRVSEVAAALRQPGQSIVARNGRSLVARRGAPATLADPLNTPRPVRRLEIWLATSLANELGAKPPQVELRFPIHRPSFEHRRLRAMHEQMGPPSREPRPPPESETPPPQDEPRGPPPELDQIERPSDPFLIAPFSVSWRTAGGETIGLSVQDPAWFTDWRKRVLFGFAASLLLLGPVGLWFARELAAPFSRFSEAAERLGRDPDTSPLEVRGPAEVAKAAAAFNLMQDRIRRYVRDRTVMIGSVAHDLRTPLTRIRFRVEEAPKSVRDKINADIDEMEAMIAATLAFVRDASTLVAREPIDLAHLTARMVEDMRAIGTEVTLDSAQPAPISGDPIALRRVIANLIANAAKFGSRARVHVSASANQAVLEVDDDGPGLGEADLERVFEPFVRIEASRSRETGGAGLGLAVCRTLARAHGGDATLINLPQGGLRARLVLPLAVSDVKI